MDNSVVINSLPHHNEVYIPNGTLVMQTLWTDESIVITLYSANVKKGYNGTLLKSKLTATADALELDVTDFMIDVKNALCTPNGLPNFTYHLSSESFKICKFTEGLRITYGEIDLTTNNDAIEQILINSIKSNAEKQTEIDALRSELSDMNETYECMKSALDKCVGEKVQMENVLLTKFAALLNTKKAKIAELEKALKSRSPVVVDDDFESDGSDSDLDYSSQSYSLGRTSNVASSSSNNESAVTVVPKRRNIQVTNETTSVREVRGSAEETKPETVDIYERETEVMMSDM